MLPTRGYYSLIQYCPDPTRAEAANVGVLLFRPEPHFLRAKVARGNDRIRRFFGSDGQDWERVNAYKAAIEQRLDVEGREITTLNALNHFVQTRANLVRITPPRPMKVLNPEADLDSLFKRLVGGRARVNSAARRLRATVARRFAAAGVEPYLERDIEIPVPALERSVSAPFGFPIDRFHLIRPMHFPDEPGPHLIQRATTVAVQGHTLYKHPDPQRGDLQLTVVGEFAGGAEEPRRKVRDFLHDFDVRLFAFEELDQLAEEIRTTAKVPPG
jgi:Protein of unknown function (DUF3037)